MNYTENIKTENKKKTKERNFYEVKDFKRKRKKSSPKLQKKTCLWFNKVSSFISFELMKIFQRCFFCEHSKLDVTYVLLQVTDVHT